MKNGYDFDPIKSIHYIQVINFIQLIKLKMEPNLGDLINIV